MSKTRNTLLNALAFVIVLVSASPALAGPPLICHPFDTGSTRLLAWSPNAGSNSNAPDRSFDLKTLTPATLRALDADDAVLSRMENLRRATIYAMQDPAAAHTRPIRVDSSALQLKKRPASGNFDDSTERTMT